MLARESLRSSASSCDPFRAFACVELAIWAVKLASPSRELTAREVNTPWRDIFFPLVETGSTWTREQTKRGTKVDAS